MISVRLVDLLAMHLGRITVRRTVNAVFRTGHERVELFACLSMSLALAGNIVAKVLN
jgi:hypothetical protein